MSSRSINLFLACFMLITLLVGVTQSTAQDSEAMKATAQGIYDALNAQDLDQYLSYYTDDVVYDVMAAPPTLNGKEELRAFMAGLLQGIPDITFTTQNILTSGDTLICEYIGAGTQTGAWMGMPATGNSAQIMVLDVMDFEGGKVKQVANYWDLQGLMVQLGLMPAGELPELVPSFTLPEPEATGLSPVDAVVETQTRWNTHDLASYAQMQHTDHVAMFIAVGVPLDRAAEAALHELYFLSISELSVERLRTIDMGDGWALCECVWTGVHDGPYFGIPATGNPISLKGAILYRFDADGLQTNMNVYFDNITVLTQMGAFPPPPETELNKIVAQRHYEEIWNQQNQTVYEEIYSPDFVGHEPTGDLVGIEALRLSVTMYLAASPDIHFTIEDQVAAGDMVATRWTSISTSTGEFMGIPPTGEQGTVTGISIDRIVDGKIVESWSSFDSLGMMQQLGVIPSSRERYDWGESDPLEVTGEAGDTEENKAVVTRYVEEVWNQGSLDVLNEIYSPNQVGHAPIEPNNPQIGIEEAKGGITAYLTAFPDLKMTIEAMFAEEDKVVTRWSFTGTHLGELMGFSASGKEVAFTGILITRLADGMIVENWWAWDALGLMQQIMPTQEEINKAIGRRVFEEVWNQGDLDLADELIAPDVVVHTPPMPDNIGVEAFKERVATYRAAFPDMQWTIEDMIAEGDKVVFRLTGTGTHEGEFMGLPPTGVQMTVLMISIARIAEGKIQESWSNSDQLGLMQQLGIIPPMNGEASGESSDRIRFDQQADATGGRCPLCDRLVEEVWHQGNLDVVDEVLTTDYILHDPAGDIIGPEGFKQDVIATRTAFPDIHITAEDIIIEGDKVVGRWTFTGTHQGELMGIPPTGSQVTVTGITIHRVAEGKFAEDWTISDTLGMMMQLGVIPPLEPVVLPGDVNGDGQIRSNDAILTLRISAGLMEATQKQVLAADMNGDGSVRSNDAILILRTVAGLAAPGIGAAGVSGEITVTLAEVYGEDGKTVAVPLKVNNISGLAGGDICIAYDSAVLRAVDVSSDAGMLLAGNVHESGIVRIAFAGSGNLNSRTLAEIQFSVIADNVSPLELEDVELYRPDALPIDSRKLDGKFISWAIPPENSALLQNFPNPFNPETWIPYQLKEDGKVTIRIYNQTGELVRDFDLGHKSAGIYANQDRSAYWDGRNEDGEEVASGIYFYSIMAGDDFSSTRKMVIRK